MALIHCHFFSKTLFLNVSAEVILPQNGTRALPSGLLPTLWLLHGEGGDHSSWQRDSAIERYAVERGMAIVMPSGENGLWTDMALGFRWFDFLSRELPEAMGRLFPLSRLREDNAVAGVGSGGYGALKLALSFPERYGAAGSFSAGNIIAGPAPSRPAGCDALGCDAPGRELATRRAEAQRKLAYACFGVEGAATVYDLPGAMGGAHDPFALAKVLVDSGRPLPSIFLAAGEADPFAANFRRTRDFFASFAGDPFRLEAREDPGFGDGTRLDRWLVQFLDLRFGAASGRIVAENTPLEK
jgi:S-formylglutathione hydrolase FrmB